MGEVWLEGFDSRGLMLPVHLPIERWTAIGETLAEFGRRLPWAIGDWLNYGEAAYGELYAHAASLAGYEPQTIANMKWVAGKWPRERRRLDVPWSLHADLAAMVSSEQDHWMDRVEDEKLSRAGLREAVRESRIRSGEEPKPVEDKSQCLRCGMNNYEIEAFNARRP